MPAPMPARHAALACRVPAGAAVPRPARPPAAPRGGGPASVRTGETSTGGGEALDSTGAVPAAAETQMALLRAAVSACRAACANAHHKALIRFRRLPLSASSEFPSFSIQSGTSKVSPSRAPSLRPYRYRHRHSRHTGTAGQGRWQWIGQRACGDMGTVRPFGLELLHGYVECAREWSRRQHPQEP